MLSHWLLSSGISVRAYRLRLRILLCLLTHHRSPLLPLATTSTHLTIAKLREKRRSYGIVSPLSQGEYEFNRVGTFGRGEREGKTARYMPSYSVAIRVRNVEARTRLGHLYNMDNKPAGGETVKGRYNAKWDFDFQQRTRGRIPVSELRGTLFWNCPRILRLACEIHSSCSSAMMMEKDAHNIINAIPTWLRVV